jgi:hypothetical protein
MMRRALVSSSTSGHSKAASSWSLKKSVVSHCACVCVCVHENACICIMRIFEGLRSVALHIWTSKVVCTCIMCLCARKFLCVCAYIICISEDVFDSSRPCDDGMRLFSWESPLRSAVGVRQSVHESYARKRHCIPQSVLFTMHVVSAAGVPRHSKMYVCIYEYIHIWYDIHACVWCVLICWQSVDDIPRNKCSISDSCNHRKHVRENACTHIDTHAITDLYMKYIHGTFLPLSHVRRISALTWRFSGKNTPTYIDIYTQTWWEPAHMSARCREMAGTIPSPASQRCWQSCRAAANEPKSCMRTLMRVCTCRFGLAKLHGILLPTH